MVESEDSTKHAKFDDVVWGEFHLERSFGQLVSNNYPGLTGWRSWSADCCGTAVRIEFFVILEQQEKGST